MERMLVVFGLAVLSAVTVVALWHHGYVGIFLVPAQTWAGVQVLVDLTLALALAMIWMWRDARACGRNVWPWVALTLAAGSFGPLAYLLTRRVPSVEPVRA
jgi:hypothetical protein